MPPVRDGMEQNISNVFKCKVPAYYGFHTAQRGPVTGRSKFKLDVPFQIVIWDKRACRFQGQEFGTLCQLS